MSSFSSQIQEKSWTLLKDKNFKGIPQYFQNWPGRKEIEINLLKESKNLIWYWSENNWRVLSVYLENWPSLTDFRWLLFLNLEFLLETAYSSPLRSYFISLIHFSHHVRNSLKWTLLEEKNKKISRYFC